MWNRQGTHREEWGPRRGRGRYDGDFERSIRGGGDRWMHASPHRGRAYGNDYWWLGEHELRRRGRLGGYDQSYRRFSEDTHPRYSPVGGMYPPFGGRYLARNPPRPLRENTWFSDWTRWF